MGRNIVAVESEKRKFEAKLKKQMSSKYWLMRTLASVTAFDRQVRSHDDGHSR